MPFTNTLMARDKRNETLCCAMYTCCYVCILMVVIAPMSGTAFQDSEKEDSLVIPASLDRLSDTPAKDARDISLYTANIFHSMLLRRQQSPSARRILRTFGS